MSDIVERLEYTAKHGLTKAADAHRYASHAEARDEIVRLRDALKDALVSVLGQRDYKEDRECATRIRAALGDKP